MKTALNKIRAHHPCRAGWEKLLRGLNKTAADDEIIWIDQVLDHNGIDDALWCLRAVENCDREIRLYAVWCARRVQHLMADLRSVAALDVAERYARGEATPEELRAAESAVEQAVNAPEWAELNWASVAAERAAQAAARRWRWASYRAKATAWTAERAAQAAALTAQSEAAWAARAAVVGCPAHNSERAAQAEELRRICREMREAKP